MALVYIADGSGSLCRKHSDQIRDGGFGTIIHDDYLNFVIILQPERKAAEHRLLELLRTAQGADDDADVWQKSSLMARREKIPRTVELDSLGFRASLLEYPRACERMSSASSQRQRQAWLNRTTSP